MLDAHDPSWLRFLSRRLRWLAIPNIAVIFIGLQILGFLYVLNDPAGLGRLLLIPDLVTNGEVWRLLTFLAIPISLSPLRMIFALWFLYFILNSIESEWGSFKTTFYILTSLVLTVIFSMVFGYPVTGVSNFASTLFLAAAALFPEHEIQIYFFIPVKMKFLGWLALAFVVFRLFQGSWMDCFFLITIYSNCLIFFGPAVLYRIKEWKRRRAYKAKWK